MKFASSISLRERLSHIAGSPLLLAVLGLATSAVAASWYRADTAQRAPDLPGYSWASHPNALLIAYPAKSCGCGSPPVERVRQGLNKGLDVVVVAAAPSKDLEALRKSKLAPSRFSLITNAAPEVVARFSAGEAAGNARIQNGRITRRASGEPPEAFFH